MYLYILFFIYYALSMLSFLHATDYIYPVATLLSKKKVALIHQISDEHIELLWWDPITNQTEQGLWSLFNPANLQILPDESGFSFIDNGRLRIQKFDRRSPRTIDFNALIYAINNIHWINEHECYFNAKHGDYAALFHLNTDTSENIDCLHAEQNKDCLYPSKVNDSLFYIERSSKVGSIDALESTYKIMKTAYHTQPTVKEHGPVESIAECIIDFYDAPIIFLSMISEQEGFVIGHQKTIETSESTICFCMYHIYASNKEILFTFRLPTALCMNGSKERLYESIMPLLPRIGDSGITFVDAILDTLNTVNTVLKPYFFDLKTRHIRLLNIVTHIELAENFHVFTPYYFDSLCFSGGRNICFLT